MLFSSPPFLFFFLPLVIGLYALAAPRARNGLLLAASLLFYAWGEPTLILVMIVSILVNYLIGVWIDSTDNNWQRNIALALAILLNLGLLAYYKYTNFVILNVNTLFHKGFSARDITMPIGISFFTFQAVSYVVDVYRRETAAQRDPLKLGLFISFFPQLIAGPILKYHQISPQIDDRTHNGSKTYDGAVRFVTGLAKKILIANAMGAIVDHIYTLPSTALSTELAWAAALSYTLQLYFDFSAYSDMAIGLAKIFGFSIPENFNFPYIAESLTDFWRRWHISLSTWFREYLYIPLGGNRKGAFRTYLNLIIVFFITGLWHGASWSFVIWGLWHGFFLIVERLFKLSGNNGKRFVRISRIAYTLLVVIIGWVFFRAPTFPEAVKMLELMFSYTRPEYGLYTVWYYFNPRSILIFVVGWIMAFGLGKNLLMPKDDSVWWVETVQVIALLFLFILSVAELAVSSYNPFIYFRF